eukprot:2364422-Amphidinium_carterae.1
MSARFWPPRAECDSHMVLPHGCGACKGLRKPALLSLLEILRWRGFFPFMRGQGFGGQGFGGAGFGSLAGPGHAHVNTTS